jgi:hypothetical protein
VPKLSWLRGLIVPFSILFILCVAFAGYYMYWVPSRQRLLDDRSFRYLKTLSDQIRLTANTYDKMLDNALASGVIVHSKEATRTNLDTFLKNVAPQLVLADVAGSNQVLGNDGYADPPKIAVLADEGTHFLYFGFRYQPEDEAEDKRILWGKTFDFAVRTDLDQLINGLLGAPDLNPFDVVLISQGDGRVIYQNSLSGIEVSEIKKLEDASGDVKGKERKQFDNAWLSPASRLEEVWIAGARYRLYSQPLQVGFLPAKQSAGIAESWVLCGLVRADRFRSESQLIPYSYILSMLAAILLAAASYPFLRLYLSSPGERLRARDVTLIAVIAFFVAAGLTIILADIYVWNRSFGPAAERDMAKLARAINANFQREQAAALSALDKMNALQRAEESNGEIQVIYSGGKGTCDPPSACEVDILQDDDEKVKKSSAIEPYPYLLYAFWSDSNGKQQVKWTTRLRPTPFVNLDEPSVPYYPELKRALKRQADTQAVRTQGIGSQYSVTTGQNITIFWKVADDPASGKANRYAVALVTQPISLYNAVLPGEFQFAVLTPDGTVVFHSDTTRNLRENFFAETGLNPDLRSRVRMRSEGAVTANYIGRPHRMYVLPMAAANQDGLWTIVIFRDLHREEVLNLEILSLVTFLLVIYAAAITLVMIVVHWMRRRQGRVWFWPDSGKTRQYHRIAVTNLLAAVLLLLLSLLSSWVHPGTLLLYAFSIPAVGLILTVVMAGRGDNLQGLPAEPDRAAWNQWQSVYFQAAATLVMLIAVLPSLCFFKVTAQFGQRLMLKHTLLKLDSDLDNRALALQALYQDVKLGAFGAQILASPDRQTTAGLDDEKQPPVSSCPEPLKAGVSSEQPPVPPLMPVFSYHELLDNCVYTLPLPQLTKSGKQPDGPTAKEPPESRFVKFMEFLLELTHPYIESADDDRHLAERTSDVWNWTSRRVGRDRILKLTKQTPGSNQARTITVRWQPFYFPWGDWVWWLAVAVLLAAVYWLVRVSFSRIFLLNLVAPPPAKDPDLNPATLMAKLPMDLLIIGPDSSHPVGSLIHRSDVQVREAEALLQNASAEAKPAGAPGDLSPTSDPLDIIIRDGRPLVLRHFERLPDDVETATETHAALVRVLSTLDNSVILLFSLDPCLIPSIESNDRWRTSLRSFVRIDLHSTPRQRKGEDDADYQQRISSTSYFHWLFDGLPRPEKMVMIQLAQENVVNPNNGHIIHKLLEQGLIERRRGLLTITDAGFANFLPHAVPRHTVKLWETKVAGTRPFSLQTSLLILGVGVVAFLLYTQGEVFNTWVTYASGLAAAVPKALQFFQNLQSKTAAKS